MKSQKKGSSKKNKLMINPSRQSRRAGGKLNHKFIASQFKDLKEKWRELIKLLPDPDQNVETLDYLEARIEEIRQATMKTAGLTDRQFSDKFFQLQETHNLFVHQVLDAKKKQNTSGSMWDKIKKVFSRPKN